MKILLASWDLLPDFALAQDNNRHFEHQGVITRIFLGQQLPHWFHL